MTTKEYQKRWQDNLRQNHLDKWIHRQTKSRCKRYGIAFDLDVSDILIPSHCPILKIPLFIRTGGKSGPLGNSPSIDRIDPSKGYTKGNIQIISQRANVMKNDATFEELKEFANWINKYIL